MDGRMSQSRSSQGIRMSQSRSSPESDAAIAGLVSHEFGVAVSRIEPLQGALDFRKFSRVWLEGPENKAESIPETLIARIEAAEDLGERPAGIPPEPPLEPIRALLEAEGLPVPRHYAADPARGIELLEDLGEVSLQDFARSASKSELEGLYAEACALPAQLQQIEPRDPVANFQRRLDAAHFRYKAERFARWSLGGDRGASPAEAQVVRDAFDRISRIASEAPQRLAHRDLQSANLHVVDRSRSAAGLVMIDLQGAFMAPPEYDLVCLLRDSYVELDDAAVDAHLARARTALPDHPDEEPFRLRFDLLTLTRKAKDHALFRAVAVERGDDRYLRYLPATRRYLQQASSRVSSKLKEYKDLNDLIQAIPELS
jgi:aminoglycoside/choline kinase family phosphotransferase